MSDADWRIREAEYHRLIRDAYNEGYSEGMREHTTSRGGVPWGQSKAMKRMNDIARDHVGTSQVSGGET